jgi:transposase
MISVGVDVHVRNLFVHAQDASGAVLTRGRCGLSLAEVAQKLGPLERLARAAGEPVKASLEATTNSRAVALLLERYGRQAGIDLTAQVLDARKLRVIAESVTKCDRLDAAVLAELTACGLRLPACHVPDADVFALREHLRCRADLVRLSTMLKNRVHALLHRRLLSPPAGADLFGLAGSAYLDSLAGTLDDAGAEALGHYRALLAAVKAELTASQKALRELARSERWKSDAAILLSVPGVGVVTAMTILAELGDYRRFARRAEVAAYAGLVPIVRDSSDKSGRGPITKRGPALLRWALIEAAHAAVRRPGVYGVLYAELAAGKPGPVAITAVARRLLEDAWTLLIKREAFRFDAASRLREAARAGRAG